MLLSLSTLLKLIQFKCYKISFLHNYTHMYCTLLHELIELHSRWLVIFHIPSKRVKCVDTISDVLKCESNYV